MMTPAFIISCIIQSRGRLIEPGKTDQVNSTYFRQTLTVEPSATGRYLTIAALEALIAAARKAGAEDSATIAINTRNSETPLYPSSLSVNVQGGPQ